MSSRNQTSHLQSTQTRIMMYSHDSYGLGHFRRTMTIAQGLVSNMPGASVLIVTGSPCATHFELPERVEVLKLPSVTKNDDGEYVSRSLPCGLDEILKLRSSLLLETFRVFQPRLLLVDHQVIGLKGELLPVLAEAERFNTKTILGLRDIIDEPAVVSREWGLPEVRRALVDSFDRVCVYGCPNVFDPRVEYPIPPELGQRIEFVGYVVREAPCARLRPLPPDRPQVLVTVGGGQDAASRLETYLDSLALKPTDWDTTLVLGPLLDVADAQRVRRRARLMGGVTVHGFLQDLPRTLADSDAVVSMAGYNTTAEILQSGVPAVLLPRTEPRREQEIRASRLARLGMVDVLNSPTPETLRGALEKALTRRPGLAPSVLRLDGARRMSEVILDILKVPHARRRISLTA
jgi:predicted glycosyltransferase